MWPRYHADGAHHIRAPKTWSLEGSNDDSNWTLLHSQANITTWELTTPTSVADGTEMKEYVLSTPASYKYYKLTISEANNDGAKTISELGLYKIGMIINQTTTSYTSTGLTLGNTYYYRVSATNSEGTSASSSITYILAITPYPPGNLTFSSISYHTATLNWTETASGADASTGYKIERSLDNSYWTTVSANTGSTAVTYSLIDLVSSTQYHYRVSGINNEGTGTASVAANFTTASNPNAPPTNFAVSSSVTQDVTLSWTAASGSPNSYTLSYGKDGSNWTEITGLTGVSKTLEGMLGVFYFRVKAVHSGGNSDWVTAPGTYKIPDIQLVTSTAGSGNFRVLVNKETFFSTGALIASQINVSNKLFLKEVSTSPTTLTGQGKIYVKNDGFLYYKSSEHGEIMVSIWKDNGSDKIIPSSLGIGSDSTPTHALTVIGNVLISGSLKIGPYTLPASDGNANWLLQSNGSGNVSWINPSETSSGGELIISRTVIYNSHLSSATQDAGQDRFYCYNVSADTSDIKYTTGTTQEANSLFHIKAEGQYLISYIIKCSDSTQSGSEERTTFTTSVRTYTGENNNTTRGTLIYEYHTGNHFSRGYVAGADSLILGGTIRLSVTAAMVSSGFQFEIRSDLVEAQGTVRVYNCDQTDTKLRIEKYTFTK